MTSIRPSAKTKKQALPLATDELRKVLDAAIENWRLPLFVAAQTGLRQGELLGLCWHDVDFDRNELHVRQQLGRDMKLGPLKTDASRRDVILSPSLVKQLKEAHLAAGRPSEGLVFVTETGRHATTA